MWLLNSLGKGVTACSLRDMATPICTCTMRVTLRTDLFALTTGHPNVLPERGAHLLMAGVNSEYIIFF